jgi:cyclase
MRIFILLGLVSFLAPFSSYAQGEDVKGTTPSKPTRTVTIVRVVDSIYMLKGKGGNIGVSKGEDGVLLIDDQFAPATNEILNLVTSLSDKPVQFLVNTHHHGDHTGGNKNMIARGVVVYAHDNARKRMIATDKVKFEKAQEAKFNETVEKLATDGNREKAEAKAKEGVQNMGDFKTPANNYPMITFSDDMTFFYNGEKIMVFHLHDAHTDGDALVYFTESNVLHTGDVFFNGRYPYIDTYNGGTYEGYIRALGQILVLIDDETKIIPGHGDLGTKANLKYSHDMMVAVRNSVAYHYVSGKSKEEIFAMDDITRAYDELGFGSGYISRTKFMELIYETTKSKYGKVTPEKKK